MAGFLFIIYVQVPDSLQCREELDEKEDEKMQLNKNKRFSVEPNASLAEVKTHLECPSCASVRSLKSITSTDNEVIEVDKTEQDLSNTYISVSKNIDTSRNCGDCANSECSPKISQNDCKVNETGDHVSEDSKLVVSGSEKRKRGEGTDDSGSVIQASGYESDSEPSIAGNSSLERLTNESDLPQDIMGAQSEKQNGLIDFTEELPLAILVKRCLAAYDVVNCAWIKTHNRNSYQVTFIVKTVKQCEFLLNKLTNLGVGKTENSSICIVPCSISYGLTEKDVVGEIEYNTESDSEDDLDRALSKKNFLRSIKSRLTVAEVVESVRAQASVTFDYIMLIILASLIAAAGLVENSAVVLVASMLVSPLMGPILGITFGSVIKDVTLRNNSLKAEIIGLCICVVGGFVVGLILGPLSDYWSSSSWPTDEMYSRGMLRSWYVGLLIALPSGAGVALSVLGGNTGSLVGVAISASLLPPAVNCGFLWAYALVRKLMSISNPCAIAIGHSEENSQFSHCPGTGYTILYSNNLAVEVSILGAVSFMLTIINIMCILLMGIFVLKIKEVAPHTSTVNTNRFWKNDIKIAREYNKTIKRGKEASTLGKRFRAEWKALNKIEPNSENSVKWEEYSKILEDVENDDVYNTVIAWAARNHNTSSLAASEKAALLRVFSVEEPSSTNLQCQVAAGDRMTKLSRHFSYSPRIFPRAKSLFHNRKFRFKESPAVNVILPGQQSPDEVSISRFIVKKVADEAIPPGEVPPDVTIPLLPILPENTAESTTNESKTV